MKVLIIGSGGREHALYENVESHNHDVYMLGNNGAISCDKLINDIDLFDFKQILKKINELEIDLTIIGPETYLELGIVDFLQSHNKKVFGPTKAMAKLESSKNFAKEVMQKANIPTAKFKYSKDIKEAKMICDEFRYPVVIKYDGLAAGKGVLVASNQSEAYEFLDSCLQFGDDGVVIEECLFGDEYSVFVMINNDNYTILPIAQDYKRVFDNDLGLNTGGMGANTTSYYDDQLPFIKQNIIKPLIKEVDYKYSGFLYIGLMQTIDGPKVIEFNARMGDPETQVVMQKLKTSIVDIILNLDNNKSTEIEVINDEVVGVVLTSKGYPKKYKTNIDMDFVSEFDNVYHMGTKKIEEKIVSTGGRICMICDKASDMFIAADKIYDKLNKLNLDDIHYRSDIAYSKVKLDEII